MRPSLEALEQIREELKEDGRLHLIDKVRCNAIKKDLEVLDILKRAPFILERLFDNFELTKEAEDRYFYGTITDAEVKKVEEWINDGR